MSNHTAIPQPKPRPIVGNLLELDPDAAIVHIGDLADTYGPLFRLNLLGYDLLVATSQNVVNELCDTKRFDKAIFASLGELRAIAGDALFTAETEEPNWAAAHRILMPTFGPAGLESMFESMMDIGEQVLLKWERLGSDHVIDVADTITRMTLDTIALCSFSYRFNSMYSTGNDHPVIEAIIRMLIEAEARYRRLPGLSKVLIHKRRQYEADKAYAYSLAEEIIADRRNHPSSAGQEDVLDRMLTTPDPVTGEYLPAENIRNQLLTFMVAGHETTSGMLSFTLYALMQYPEVLARARAEVDEVLGGRRPRFEDVARLPYLDAMLKESLRLWPTATAFAVKPLSDTTLAGYDVREGQHIVIPMMKLHRDPTVWEDPLRFDPERFLFERAQHIAPNAWKPYGNGQRSCIGRGFAVQESILFLATLLQRFTPVFADPDYTLSVVQTLTIRPGDLQMRLLPRTDGPEYVSAAPAPAAPRVLKTAAPVHKSGQGVRVRVLYGSEGGTTKGFAERIAADATARGFTAELNTLDSAVDDVQADGLTVIVCCSYEGQPPEGAKDFMSWLSATDADLAGVRFAVFGCGNTDWARTYQAIPIAIDNGLERLGATRLMARGQANARADFFGDFEDWYSRFWGPVHEGLGLEPPAPDSTPALAVQIGATTREPLLARHSLQMATVIDSRPLVDVDKPGARPKHHIELALPAGTTYSTGDYLVVLPKNPPALVDRALRRLGLAGDTVITIDSTAATALPVGTAHTLADLLSGWIDLGQPATRTAVLSLAGHTTCPQTAAFLHELAAPDRYQAEVLSRRVSVLDLLDRFPTCTPELADLLGLLPPLLPRQYSISSSPRRSGEHLTLTAAVVRGPALSGTGRFEGIASSYLERSMPGDRVAVAVKQSDPAFSPPPLSTPVIMVCAGSGLAPFRGFLHDRAQQSADEGVAPEPALLFFGCDAPDLDLLYQDELDALQRDGIVEVRTAFSTTPRDGQRFVQDRLWADRADVIELYKQGATIFVCGDGQAMAPAVRDTVARIYADATGVDSTQAEDWIRQCEADKRYVADVFA